MFEAEMMMRKQEFEETCREFESKKLEWEKENKKFADLYAAADDILELEIGGVKKI